MKHADLAHTLHGISDWPAEIAPPLGCKLVWQSGADTVQGGYSWLHPNEIRLLASFQHAEPSMVAAVFAHELRHMWQHRHYGLWYPILACRWWARWTIEPSAYAVERWVHICMGNVGLADCD